MARQESTYPGSLDSFTHATTDFNPGDAVPSTDFERLIDAIKKIQTELGTDPAGSLTDVKTRLAVSINDDGTLKAFSSLTVSGDSNLDGAVTINNSEADKDFRVAGNTNTNLIVADGGNNNVSINAAAISVNYDLGLLGDGVLCIKETSTPTADTNYGKLYTKNTDKMFFQDGAGTEHELPALTEAEASQLKNLGDVTVSYTQWGALGALVEWTDWTPNLTGGADLSGYDTARYYRIGQMCFIYFSASGKNVTSSGHIQITLPFTVANIGSVPYASQLYDGSAYVGPIHGYFRINTNWVTVFKTAEAGNWVGNETDVGIQISGFFEIA